MSTTHAAALAPLALALAAPSAAAQTITPVVVEGDSVPGVGSVTSIGNLAVNLDGTTLVEVDTNNPDTDADGAMLRDGALYLREGQALVAPAGATLDSFDSATLDTFGQASFNHFLDGTSGTSDDSGVYRDDVLIVQEGGLSTAPELTAGTPFIGFFDTKINDASQVFVMASVDDPLIPSGVDRALVVFTLSGTGTVLSEEARFKEGDLLPGQTELVEDFETDPMESDFNGLGQLLFSAELSGDPLADRVVYLDTLELAQEGDPSPVPGRNWASLFSPKLGLNNSGQYVYTGGLDGDPATSAVIIKDGAVLVQEGDVLPAIAPYAIESFGAGPVRIADDGRALWYGEWSDPDGDIDSGLFLDHQLVVQEGVTTVGGLAIDTLRAITDGYANSDDGRWVIFEAVLEGGNEGAFLLDTAGASSAPFCLGDGSAAPCPCGNLGVGAVGCANSTGLGGGLSSTGTDSISIDDLGFAASDLLPGQPALLFAGENAIAGGAGIPFGDGLRCAGMNVIRLGVESPDGSGAASWGPGLGSMAGYGVGDVRHFQCWYRDPIGSPCGAGFNLTNGFTVVFVP